MQAEKTEMKLELLPSELLILILSFLDVKSLSTVALSSHSLKVAARDNLLWKIIFNQYYPIFYIKLSEEENTNWRLAFVERFNRMYKGLPENLKHLFYLAIVNNIKALKEELTTLNLKFEDLNTFRIGLASKGHHQVLLDYFYQIAFRQYLTEDGVLNTSKQDKHGNTILHWAAMCNQLESIEDLLIQGCDVNVANKEASPPLFLAAKFNHVEAVRRLLKNNTKAKVNGRIPGEPTPLCIAALNGWVEIVEILLEKGAEVNASTRMGNTPLRMAVRNNVENNCVEDNVVGDNYAEIIKILLENGANVDTKYLDLIPWLPVEETPWSVAVEKGYANVVEMMLQKKANDHSKSENHQPIQSSIVLKNRVSSAPIPHSSSFFSRNRNVKNNEAGLPVGYEKVQNLMVALKANGIKSLFWKQEENEKLAVLFLQAILDHAKSKKAELRDSVIWAMDEYPHLFQKALKEPQTCSLISDLLSVEVENKSAETISFNHSN